MQMASHYSITEEKKPPVMFSVIRKNYRNFCTEWGWKVKVFSSNLYCAKDGHTLDCLEITWGRDREFKGDYFRDHQAVCNTVSDL